MTPSIEKIDESKNFITYREITSGIKICLDRDQIKMALGRFQVYRKIDYTTDFYTNLFRLINIADEQNFLKIMAGFPAETIIYLLWKESGKPDTKFIDDTRKRIEQ